MTYQVLARKWRPQDFDSLVGQEPIVTALRNALTEGRIAQAYLFSGIRGVGKTTAARVLAKALNCEGGATGGEGPSVDPCNECTPCREITSGNDMDVLEVDAATYSKVEQVRELTESLRYGSARDRYKVVVLDEVHRLSRQAFDALLKIVEEPPPHLVFIFATTEIDAVPATILSRCQEFQFRRVPSPVLAQHLRRISDAEEITVSDPALRLISRAGEGSVRDAVALLDQLATFGNGTIADEDAKNLLGGLDTEIFHQLLSAILAGERRTIVEIVREIEGTGWDPHHVYGQFLLFARDALQLALGGAAEDLDLPLEEAKRLAERVASEGPEALLRLLQLLLTSEPTVRRSEYGLLALEISWLRAAELPKVTRIEDLLSGRAPFEPPSGSGGGGRPQGGSGGQTRATGARSTGTHNAGTHTTEARSTDKRSADAPTAGAPTEAHSPPARDLAPQSEHRASVEAPPPAALDRRGAGTTDGLSDLLRQLSGRRPSLAALLKRHAEHLRRHGDQLEIPAGDRLLEEALGRAANRRILEQLLEDDWGPEAGWSWGPKVEPGATPPPPAGPSASLPSSADPSDSSTTVPGPETDLPNTAVMAAGVSGGHDLSDPSSAAQHPAVKAVLDVFGGKIQRVQPVTEDSPTP